MATKPHQSAFALGIDVAHFDGDVDWGSVLQAGMSFGFAKATDGLSSPDSKFTQNWQRMGEVGITRGAYHFYRGSKDAQTQAEHFLNTVTLGPADMPAVLDIEVADGASGATLVEGISTWLLAVKEATGKTPIIYTGPGFWEDHMQNDGFGGYPLWIAHYTHAAAPKLPIGWDDWTFWQYASGESGEFKIPGVAQAVDINRFNGSHDALVQKLGLGG